ncbi:DUF2911 domain-containing protein [Mongoliibacter ruber]|uniref:DUF2911 family protein n=1 Tax=Mongoliibacter ruber TaxID=1750599 RepID=A0A2T0WPC0_9BACT|nr:DUF2911 domain-containing protein [Mongoliibacter ruber]PRY88537.1 Protein of unknown function (DUF2911) [Mongoliibacter ruber]
MKTKNYLIILSSMIILSCSSNKEEGKVEESNGHAHHDHGATSEAANSKSPRTAAMANIGSNHVHVVYSAPSVRGRQVFGGLVAYDEVWVTGAHSATSISFNEDLIIEGESVPAGKYALFTIPKENGWTVILNSNYEQHLADDYDQTEDVLRVEVENIPSADQVEQLKFEVISKDTQTGELKFSWAERSFVINLKAQN